MNFNDLGLIDPLLKALQDEGYQSPTSIQEDAIPALLTGRDLLATAQTGTGKTAAFALPILQQLYQAVGQQKHHQLRVLILAPTRELVAQIKESFLNYGAHLPFTTVAIFGGVPKAGQIKAIRKGCDILVATPGRLFDIINTIDLKVDTVRYFVLDEADRMLDMGFARDVEKIVTYLKAEKQTMLFSATMPKEIIALANKLLKDPLRIHEDPGTPVVQQIAQSVYLVGRRQKKDLLVHLLQGSNIYQALVFSRTKRGADRISKTLNSYGISNATLHGNKSQNIREQALKAFKHNDVRVLVATDIAARGIDIQELSHVINFDIPEDSETYIHRIGRTGRAGFSGTALSFCEPGEVRSLRDVEKLIGNKIPVVKDHPYESTFKNQALDLTGILPEPLHPIEEEEVKRPRGGERSKRQAAPERKRTVKKENTQGNPVDAFFKEEDISSQSTSENKPAIFRRKNQDDVYSESEKHKEKAPFDRFKKKRETRSFDKTSKPASRRPNSDSADQRFGEDRKPRFARETGTDGYARDRKKTGDRFAKKTYGEKTYASKTMTDRLDEKTDSRPRRTDNRKPYSGEKRYEKTDNGQRKDFGESRSRTRFDRGPSAGRGPRKDEREKSGFDNSRRSSFDRSSRSSSSEGYAPRQEGRSYAKGSRSSQNGEGRVTRAKGTGARSEGRSFDKARGTSSTSAKRPYSRRKDF